MQLFLASLLIVAVAADRLDYKYLPPNSARLAGGNSNFLNVGLSGGVLPSGTYGVPNGNNFGASGGSGGVNPSEAYGVPGGYVYGPSRDASAGVVGYATNANFGDGSYTLGFETENGISQQESGGLKNAGTDQESSFVEGSYSYTGDDGQVYTVNYVADENGFHASGEHLPTPPPIPEAIQKSLDLIAAQAAAGYVYPPGEGSGSNGFLGGSGGNFNQQTGYQY